MMYNNTEEVVDRIEKVLQDGAYMMMFMGTSIQTFPVIPDLEANPNAANANFSSDANNTEGERFVEKYANKQTDAMRKIIEVIVKETLNYIMETGMIAAAERYDKLEEDYNKFLATLELLKANTATASIGSMLAPAVVAGGGATRALQTTNMILSNETIPQNDPSGSRIYIK